MQELVLGRSLELLVVLINMYNDRYGSVLILVSMFGGVVRASWTICCEHGSIYTSSSRNTKVNEVER
jgi:hypothetical protein